LNAIQAKGLTKRYGDLAAVDRLDLTVEPGILYGFLGPNGAGKTTTIRMILGLVFPTEGEVDVLGEPVSVSGVAPRALRRVGAIIEEPAAWTYLSGRKNLEYFARAGWPTGDVDDRLGRVDEVLRLVGLEQAAGKKVKAYSQGMRQRLGIAMALLGRPELLVLDEPTNGLDPLAARQLRELIQRLAGEGRTILIATHDLVEAEALCDRVTMINHGRVVAAEAPKTLARLISQQDRVRIRAGETLLERVRTLPGVLGVEPADDGTAVISVESQEAVGKVLAFVVEQGVTEVRTELPGLEEVYLRLVHRNEKRSVVKR
jgi:ABC-2 type transport system ATP-binding protein